MKKAITIIAILVFTLVLSIQGYSLEIDFNKIFDENKSIMLITENDTGIILYANEAACSFYGYEKEELESMKMDEINIFTKEDFAEERLKAEFENRDYIIVKHKSSDGEVHSVQVKSHEIVENNKTLLFSIITDVTNEILSEQKSKKISFLFFIILSIFSVVLILLFLIQINNLNRLKQKNKEILRIEKLRKTFLDTDKSMIYLKDNDSKFVFVNKALAEFYGRTESEIIKHTDFDFSEIENADSCKVTDKEVLSKKEVVVNEKILNNNIYQVTKFPVELLDGKLGIGAYIKDITQEYKDRMQKENTLFVNEVLFEVTEKNFESRDKRFDYLLNKLVKLTKSKIGFIFTYNEDDESFNMRSLYSDMSEKFMEENKFTNKKMEDAGLWAESVRQRKPLIYNDFQKSIIKRKGMPEGHTEIKKYISVPIFVDNKIKLIVGLANKKENYNDDDIYHISVLMNGVWNIIERKKIQNELKIEKNKYYQTLVSIGDGVMVVDMNGKIEMLNNISEKLTGWKNVEALGKHYKDVFVLSHENEKHSINDPVEEVLKTGNASELRDYTILTSRKRVKYHIEDSAAPIKDNDGTIIGVVLVFRDMTLKKEQRREIEYLSYHDALTGLYNRRFFEEEMMRLDTPGNYPLSIVMGDLNSLKLTNDAFGHSEGDNLLKKAGKILAKHFRESDIISRVGGDEFVILLPNTDSKDVESIVNRINEDSSEDEKKTGLLSIAFGWDTKFNESQDLHDVFKNAENYMYKKKISENQGLRGLTIKTIINTLFEKSPREKAHSERVKDIAIQIAEELNLTRHEINEISTLGLLHDIGKIIIPSRVLEKPSRLDEIEREEIKKHPSIGFRILSTSEDFANIAIGVLNHHERWDGNGYPEGKKGEKIPLEARIIAIADSFDAMTASRPYRETGLTVDEAAAEIINNAGKQFDPYISRVFIEKVLKKEWIN